MLDTVIYSHAREHAYIHGNSHFYENTHTHAHTHPHIHVYVHVCGDECMYKSTCVFLQMSHTHVCAPCAPQLPAIGCMSICIHMYRCMHTHVYTHTCVVGALQGMVLGCVMMQGAIGGAAIECALLQCSTELGNAVLAHTVVIIITSVRSLLLPRCVI